MKAQFLILEEDREWERYMQAYVGQRRREQPHSYTLKDRSNKDGENGFC